VPLGDLGGGLDAGQAAARHHDRSLVEAVEPGGEGLGVVETVERVRVLGGARHGRGVGGAAEGVDQRVEA
jgi:hypothetical protein